MKTSIKLLLATAVLAACSSTAFGQTVINGTLTDSGPDLNSLIDGNFSRGQYVAAVSKYGSMNTGDPYTPTYFPGDDALPPVAATPVPVAGIPALALGSLALIGATGFVSRRRKAKAEKA